MKIKLFTILLLTSFGGLLAEQPTTLFCHGIIDTHEQADRYQAFLQQPYESFDFPDAQPAHGYNFNNLLFLINELIRSQKPLNRQSMFMGYDQDVQTLYHQIDPLKDYILYGFSRGGTATINYLAQYNPHNIKALILNATPANLLDGIDEFQAKMGYRVAATDTQKEAIFRTLFPAYPINSIPPLQTITKIKNKKLPILLIHSKHDTIVPIAASWKLYVALLQAGFDNVYLCELESGQHKDYPNGPDKMTYLKAQHSFYKYFNLDYNPEFATLDLKTLQPSIQKIQDKITSYEQALNTAYQQAQKNILFNTKIVLGLTTTALAYAYFSQNKESSYTFDGR
ncbi:MAG: alpha/beta hydrolase [Candidatus Chromulinivorax sp.]